MNLQNKYYYYEKAIPDRLCNLIIKEAENREEQKGVVNKGTNNKESKLQEDVRDSYVTWFNDPWLYKIITPFLTDANKQANWNFDVDWNENIQFTKYKLNQFYDWHTDDFGSPYTKNCAPKYMGKQRKLSMSILLNDGSEFKGGNLEFDFRDTNDIKDNKPLTFLNARKKGTLVVFPSFIWHRVTPVTFGTRYSLVMWSLGKPYR